ncbi:MAG: hypothetical protein HQK96_21695 [Nitrospirae bacterium]|nr:hypothetical protein [Nitrospirota bacterium]
MNGYKNISIAAKGLLEFMEYFSFPRKLAIVYYIRKMLLLIESRNNRVINNDSELLRLIAHRYDENLKKFITLWDKHVHIYLIGLPFLFDKEDSAKQARTAALYWNVPEESLLKEVRYMPILEKLEHDVRRDVSEKLNISHFETGKEIKEHTFSKRIRLFIDSVHMNSTGTEIIAGEILQHLSGGRQ